MGKPLCPSFSFSCKWFLFSYKLTDEGLSVPGVNGLGHYHGHILLEKMRISFSLDDFLMAMWELQQQTYLQTMNCSFKNTNLLLCFTGWLSQEEERTLICPAVTMELWDAAVSVNPTAGVHVPQSFKTAVSIRSAHTTGASVYSHVRTKGRAAATLILFPCHGSWGLQNQGWKADSGIHTEYNNSKNYSYYKVSSFFSVCQRGPHCRGVESSTSSGCWDEGFQLYPTDCGIALPNLASALTFKSNA